MNYRSNNGFDNKVDERSALMMLAYGHMLENLTPIDQIKKLCAGEYLTVKRKIIM